MKNIFLKLNTILIVCIIIFACITGLYEAEIIRKYKIERFDIDATIEKDGSMRVIEKTDYNFKGKYNGITITIPEKIDDEYYASMTKASINDSVLSDYLYNNSGIKDVKIYVLEDGNTRLFNKVGSASIGDIGVYTEEKDSNGYITYRIYEPSKNENKMFVIEYTLQNVAVVHDDVGEVWWNFVGGGVECKISNLNINVSTKYGNISEAYVHSNETAKVDSISKNVANVSVKGINKNEFVGVRLVFPKSNIADSKKFSHITAEEIIHSQEKSYTDKSNTRIILNVISIIITSGLLLYWLYLILNYEKEYTYDVNVIDNLSILEKYNPMIAACIAQNRDMHPRDVLALLIDMVNRGILDLEVQKSINRKWGNENNTYILRKNKEFFDNPEKSGQLDDIERSVLKIFFDESEHINLENKLRRINNDDEVVEKLQRLDELVTNKLDQIGANFIRVPKRLLVLNNIIFIACMIYIFAVVGFNIMLGLSTLSTANTSITSQTIEMAIFFIGFAVIMLPISMKLLIVLVRLINKIKNIFGKLSFRIISKKFTQTVIRIVLIFAIIFTLEAIFWSKSYIIICTILFMMVLLLVLTDNLMSSHSMKIINDYIYLKSIQEVIETDSFLNEKKIEDRVLWEKYLAFAIALGVGNVANLVKHIPNFEKFESLTEKLDNLYDLYYDVRDLEAEEKLRHFESIIEDLTDSVRGCSYDGGYSDGSSSSFGGGGFSGGGRWWPEEEVHFSKILNKY